MSAQFLEFTRVNDAAAATTKKLQKQSIFASYLRLLSESDLRLAVRYTSGRAFAPTDERVLSVGWSLMNDAVMPLLPIPPDSFHQLMVRKGEMGEALAAVWPSMLCNVVHPLTLSDLSLSFDELAATGAQERKREILTHIFARCLDGREAAYLSKIIFRDMRTGVQEGVLQGAIAEAFDCTLPSVHRCQMLVGDLDEVAVLASRRGLELAHFRLFHPLQFMLATPRDTPQEAATTMSGRTFLAEDKLDGIRAQVHKSGGRVEIFSRTMDRVQESFPEIVAGVSQLPGEFLLDGEIVPWQDGGVAPFAQLQKRLGRKLLTRKLLQAHPVVFIPFDCLYRDGRLLMDCPLQDRRDQLSQLLSVGLPRGLQSLTLDGNSIVCSVEEVAAAFAAARTRRNEGIVLKDPASSYSPGRRGQSWLKLKTHLPTLDCVVTAAEYGHGKRRDSLSDYTFAVWDDDPSEPEWKLLNVGKAYSGVTDEEIAQLTEIFLKLTRGRHGRLHVVDPRIVLEIACDQIQRSARHASGFAFRFPRIKRVRWDKSPEDADRLSRVRQIYESSSNFAKGAREPSPDTPEPTLFDGLP